MVRVAIPPWQAALQRWGDPAFSLALLATDDRPAAERLAAALLARALRDTSQTLDVRIYGAILAAAHDRRITLPQRRPLRRHALPSELARLAPAERVLLGLVLLYGVDLGVLSALTRVDAPALLQRVAAALQSLDRSAAVAPEEQALFEAWLQGMLDAERGPLRGLDHPPARGHERRWQGMLDATRALLRKAVGGARLPGAAAEATAAALEAPDGGPAPWWQRTPARLGGVVLLVCALALLVIMPRHRPAPDANPAQPTPREVAQQALVAWGSLPGDEPLHLRVWARLPEEPAGAPQLTEVWIAPGSSRHRIEVRRADRLVEWQMGDGQLRLQYAALPNASSCRWAEPVALDTAVRLYRVDAVAQQWALQARLTLGTYGVGAQVLSAAIAADDLHSFGTRVEAGTRLVALGFTDQTVAGPRQLILWIDPLRRQLHRVQVLSGAQDQGTGRDLWRLETRDTAAVPASDPDWKRTTVTPSALLDPACPGLDTAHVVSVRTLVGGAWWGAAYLPALLPPEITGAALLSATPAGSQGSHDNLRAVFVGPGRWLRLQLLPPAGVRPTQGVRMGQWTVQLAETANGLAGSACRGVLDQPCDSSVGFESRGFSREQIGALVQSFQPLNAQTWVRFEAQFLEPAPVADEVKPVLTRALAAQEPRPGHTLQSVLEWRVRLGPRRPTPRSPYEPDPAVVEPERLKQTVTLEYGAAGVTRFRELLQLPDGRAYQVRASDGSVAASYTLWDGVAVTADATNMEHVKVPEAPGATLIQAFLNSTEPITLVRRSDAIQLTQRVRLAGDAGTLDGTGPLAPWLDDMPGGLVLRRMWLDSATSLPLRAETVYIAGNFHETQLSSAVVTSIGFLAQPLPDEAYGLPSLDPETVVIKHTPSATFIGSAALNLDAVSHALVWQAVPGIVPQFDSRPTRFGTDPTVSTDPRLEQAVYVTLPQLELLGQLKVTTYALADGRQLTVRQGPRGLLRHSLRASFKQQQASVSAPAILLRIADQPREGWLIDLDGTPTLVFEVDDVLVYVAGLSADALRTELPPLLEQLRWGEP